MPSRTNGHRHAGRLRRAAGHDRRRARIAADAMGQRFGRRAIRRGAAGCGLKTGGWAGPKLGQCRRRWWRGVDWRKGTGERGLAEEERDEAREAGPPVAAGGSSRRGRPIARAGADPSQDVAADTSATTCSDKVIRMGSSARAGFEDLRDPPVIADRAPVERHLPPGRPPCVCRGQWRRRNRDGYDAYQCSKTAMSISKKSPAISASVGAEAAEPGLPALGGVGGTVAGRGVDLSGEPGFPALRLNPCYRRHNGDACFTGARGRFLAGFAVQSQRLAHQFLITRNREFRGTEQGWAGRNREFAAADCRHGIARSHGSARAALSRARPRTAAVARPRRPARSRWCEA